MIYEYPSRKRFYCSKKCSNKSTMNGKKLKGIPHKPIKTALMDRVKKLPNDCWEWMGSKDKDGYGVMGHVKTKYQRAHMISFEIFRTEKIDKNLIMHHICKNKACVNPNHLKQVKLSENKRLDSKKLNNSKINHIRKLSKVMKQWEIGKMFNIHQSYVSRIINNKRWNYARC